MIVCNCNCLKERDLEDACRPDICSAEKLYETLGCRFKCGRCIPYVQEIVMEQAVSLQMA